MVLERLIEFGLSHNEAKVYMALMELGSSTVTQIARRAKVTRTNAYHLLNSLLVHGLASMNQGKGKTVFSAEKPERLLYMMKEKMDEAEKRYKDAENLIAELRTLHKGTEEKMKVRYYEGEEGIITVYEDTLRAHGKILEYASADERLKFSPEYFHKYYERRAEKGIETDAIMAKNTESLRLKQRDEANASMIKIIPEEFGSATDVSVYDGKVAIVSLKDKFAVVLESDEIANAFKKILTLSNERAQDYTKLLSDILKKKV
ncbi:MAG: helix-turn-helix domain-containing protein [Candidatus Gracilibacteria bacterium]|jgi:sugar-specific transcriptional regulator TrmB